MTEGLFLQDCLEGMQSLPPMSVHCVVTDPPYGINFVSCHRKYESNVDRAVEGDAKFNEEWFDSVLAECHRILDDNTHIYVFCNDLVIDRMKPVFARRFTFKNILIWNKKNTGMGDLEGQYGKDFELILFGHKGRRLLSGRRHPAIISVPRIDPNQLIHSCQKPLSLISFLIENSTQPGEVVCDPFTGSGTTMIAANGLGRKFVGFEVDKETYDIAVKRVKEDAEQTRLF